MSSHRLPPWLHPLVLRDLQPGAAPGTPRRPSGAGRHSLHLHRRAWRAPDAVLVERGGSSPLMEHMPRPGPRLTLFHLLLTEGILSILQVGTLRA